MKKLIRKTVRLDDLTEAPYNPENRTSEDKCRDLYTSMDLYGLLSDILITPDNRIIEGHRRVATAKRLGWTEIDCKVIEENEAAVYASVNITSRKMAGTDALSVWLKEPLAVSARMNKNFKKMEEQIGRVLVKRIQQSGCSARVFATARKIARYCGLDDAESVKSVVEWLLDFASIGQVMKALEAGVDGKKILKAVQSGKPIILRLDVA